MNNQFRNAVEAHLKAISQWAFVATLDGEPDAQVAHRVKIARDLSEKAVTAHARTDLARRAAHLVDPLNQIEAACHDAEAKAAIDAHADALKLLVG